MRKETKNGLKAVGIGWLGMALVLGIVFLVAAVPLVGLIMILVVFAVLISATFFIMGAK